MQASDKGLTVQEWCCGCPHGTLQLPLSKPCIHSLCCNKQHASTVHVHWAVVAVWCCWKTSASDANMLMTGCAMQGVFTINRQALLMSLQFCDGEQDPSKHSMRQSRLCSPHSSDLIDLSVLSKGQRSASNERLHRRCFIGKQLWWFLLQVGA